MDTNNHIDFGDLLSVLPKSNQEKYSDRMVRRSIGLVIPRGWTVLFKNKRGQHEER